MRSVMGRQVFGATASSRAAYGRYLFCVWLAFICKYDVKVANGKPPCALWQGRTHIEFANDLDEEVELVRASHGVEDVLVLNSAPAKVANMPHPSLLGWIAEGTLRGEDV